MSQILHGKMIGTEYVRKLMQHINKTNDKLDAHAYAAQVRARKPAMQVKRLTEPMP